MPGWIKLHRCLLDKAVWQLSDAQRVVFITVLLMANHEGKQWIWKGTQFNAAPGQFVTSLPKLSKTASVSVQSVRTALENLKKLDFLTYQSTDTGRLITVNNWELYQRDEKKSTDKSTGKQQTANRLSTSNNNDKNINNISCPIFEKFYKEYPRHEGRADAEKAWKKIKESEHEAIFGALSKYKIAVAGKEKQYIKMPSSWLNSRRWEDEIETSQPKQTELGKDFWRGAL